MENDSKKKTSEEKKTPEEKKKAMMELYQKLADIIREGFELHDRPVTTRIENRYADFYVLLIDDKPAVAASGTGAFYHALWGFLKGIHFVWDD